MVEATISKFSSVSRISCISRRSHIREKSEWMRRGQRLKLPNEMGVTNHFAQSGILLHHGSGLGSDCHPYRRNSPTPQWDTAPTSGRNGPTVATMNTTPTDPFLQAPSSIGSPAPDQPIPTRRQQLMQWAGQGPDTPAQVGSASMRRRLRHRTSPCQNP